MLLKFYIPGYFPWHFFQSFLLNVCNECWYNITCCLIYGGVISLNGQPITTYSSIATHQTTQGACSFGNFSFDSTTVKIRVVMLNNDCCLDMTTVDKEGTLHVIIFFNYRGRADSKMVH